MEWALVKIPSEQLQAPTQSQVELHLSTCVICQRRLGAIRQNLLLIDSGCVAPETASGEATEQAIPATIGSLELC